MQLFKDFFKNRTIKFYIAMGAAVLSIITGIVYGAAVAVLDEGISVAPTVMCIVAALIFAVCALFRLSRIGMAAVGIIDLFALFIFLVTGYEYPIEQAMVVSNAWQIKGMISIIVCAAMMLVCIILANVFAWLRLDKEPEAATDVAMKGGTV